MTKGERAVDQEAVDNLLLRRMAPRDFAQLQPHLQRVPLRLEETLAAALS